MKRKTEEIEEQPYPSNEEEEAELAHNDQQEDNFPPENQIEFFNELAKNDAVKFFEWLIKDLSMANLKEHDKRFVTEGLEVLKQVMDIEGGQIKTGSASEDILHDVFARCVVSGSESMKKFQQFFTQNRKSTYEYKQDQLKKKRAGLLG